MGRQHKCHKHRSSFKVIFPGDDCPRTPDFLIAGAGSSGLPLAYGLSNSGYRVLVIEAGLDQSENVQVQQPFVPSAFQGTGPIQLNINNALYDPNVSSFMGTTGGIGGCWKSMPSWDGRGVGGGGLHWFLDYVRPTNTIIDGPLPAGMIPPPSVPYSVSTAALAEAGGPAWNSTTINAIIKNFENFMGVSQDPSFRGHSGPQIMMQLAPYPPTGNQAVLINAMSAAAPLVPGGAACPSVEDYNVPDAVNSVSQLQFLLKFDPSVGTVVRQNSATSWANSSIVAPDGKGNLVGVNGRKLIILTDRTVIRSVKDKEKSCKYGSYVSAGVEFTYKNKTYFVKAKNVIASMGATYTPLFWQRSGIASKALLDKVGIPMQVNSPFMGLNLTNQIGPRILCSTTNILYSENFYGQAFVQQNNIPRRFQVIQLGLGEISYAIVTSGQVYPAQPAQTTITNQVTLPVTTIDVVSTATYPLTGTIVVNGQNLDYTGKTLTSFTGITGGTTGTVLNVGDSVVSVPIYYFFFDVFICEPRSRGYSQIVLADYGEQFDLNWGIFNDGPDPNDPSSGLSDPDSDMYVSCDAMDFLYNTFVNMRDTDLSSHINLVNPPPEIFTITNKADRFLQYVPYITMQLCQAAHQSSTCVMNNDPNKGVVDGNLKIHGTKNCFCCDYSISSVINSGNTAAYEQAVGINGSNVIPQVALL